ncbi:MAG: L,D-transpeptidase [Hyphomicrobiaceae bacterium]
MLSPKHWKPLLAVTLATSVMVEAMPAAAQSYPSYGYGEPRPRYLRPFSEDDRYAPPRYWREEPPRAYSTIRPWRGPDYEPPYDRRPVPATPLSPYERRNASAEPPSANKRDGGPRPEITPMPPQLIPFNSSYAVGTIIIETRGRHLLLVTSKRAALRYPISVGREGFQWTGSEKISRIADWPDWHPPAEMRKRDPSLPEMMTGGLRNPLGAKALYLGSSLYRIHGTNDARTIGYASSSGCFRMLNGHVVDLAGRVGVGTTVVVVDKLPRDATVAPLPERGPEPRWERGRSRG